VDFGHAKISNTIFSGQSLLLSTTALNDTIKSKQTRIFKNLKNFNPYVLLAHYSRLTRYSQKANILDPRKPLKQTAIIKEPFTLSKYFYHYVTHHKIVVKIV